MAKSNKKNAKEQKGRGSKKPTGIAMATPKRKDPDGPDELERLHQLILEKVESGELSQKTAVLAYTRVLSRWFQRRLDREEWAEHVRFAADARRVCR